MDQICLTCLRMEGKIEAIPLCDKSLRASRRNNFGLVVKSQVTDIIDLLLQHVRHPNGVHRSSRGAVLSTSAVQWATTKFDGVWSISLQTGTGESCQALTTVAWWYL